jgi:hypothetical protein
MVWRSGRTLVQSELLRRGIHHMAALGRLALVLALIVTLAGCSKPTDIVFGPDPLKQIAEQGDRFKKLSEDDRSLLVAYLTVSAMGKAFGAEIKPATGRTVGEVLVDARAWREKVRAAEAGAKQREAAEAALKVIVVAERKAIADKIAESVIVAITDKKVLPKDLNAGRFNDLLVLHYAIENKSDKPIRQLKGQVVFLDATGDKVGDLPVDIDERVAPGVPRPVSWTPGCES